MIYECNEEKTGHLGPIINTMFESGFEADADDHSQIDGIKIVRVPITDEAQIRATGHHVRDLRTPVFIRQLWQQDKGLWLKAEWLLEKSREDKASV